MTEPVPATSDLSQRYGVPAPWRRPALITVAGLLVLVFLGWVAWVAWSQGTPSAESELVGFEVTGDSSAVAFVAVRLEEDSTVASCRVRAFAEDHTTVGEVAFTPDQGRNHVVVRTERRAINVELIGCTTPDQPRPR